MALCRATLPKKSKLVAVCKRNSNDTVISNHDAIQTTFTSNIPVRNRPNDILVSNSITVPSGRPGHQSNRMTISRFRVAGYEDIGRSVIAIAN